MEVQVEIMEVREEEMAVMIRIGLSFLGPFY